MHPAPNHGRKLQIPPEKVQRPTHGRQGRVRPQPPTARPRLRHQTRRAPPKVEIGKRTPQPPRGGNPRPALPHSRVRAHRQEQRTAKRQVRRQPQTPHDDPARGSAPGVGQDERGDAAQVLRPEEGNQQTAAGAAKCHEQCQQQPAQQFAVQCGRARVQECALEHSGPAGDGAGGGAAAERFAEGERKRRSAAQTGGRVGAGGRSAREDHRSVQGVRWPVNDDDCDRDQCSG
uniref:(northern house mosquito) hypothetical protein n=1 Tax=Culex pipiens TaxID=7175 RepID=A0A8D8G6R0_CULPI